MQVIDYKDEFYESISSWWDVHKEWESIPKSLLPTTGLVVHDENTLLCVGFLYIDGTSPVCMLEWIVANPENSARTSIKALRLLLNAFGEYADANSKVLFTTVRQPKLAGLYEKSGFILADSNMINMTRVPNGRSN